MGVRWSKQNHEGGDEDNHPEMDAEEDEVYRGSQISYQLVQTEIALRRTAHPGSLRVVISMETRPLAGSLIAQDNAEEHIFERQDRCEVDRMFALLRKFALRNIALAENVMCFPDFFEDFRKLLSTYSKGKRSVERRQNLLQKFQHEDSSPTIVLLIRLITAIEIHMRRTAYPEDVLGEKYSNLGEFCTGEVFPIGNKHVHAAVLSNALGVPIRVVDLAPAPPNSSEMSTEDKPNSTAANAGSSNTSIPTATRKGATAPFKITLLYRPENCYDILYPIPDEVTFCGFGTFCF